MMESGTGVELSIIHHRSPSLNWARGSGVLWGALKYRGDAVRVRRQPTYVRLLPRRRSWVLSCTLQRTLAIVLVIPVTRRVGLRSTSPFG